MYKGLITNSQVALFTQNFFADDTSLFTVVEDLDSAASDMNHDLELIRRWAHDWKMSFNPDPQKQAVELIFSMKRIEMNHPEIRFNKVDEHKHLGINLDSKLVPTHLSYISPSTYLGTP